MSKTIFYSLVLAFAALVIQTPFSQTAFADDGEMTIGTKAPDLDIEHWVSDRNGEFSHTTELEKGKVYVVEFWATWCGPCIREMPSISAMQDEYADKDVQIISVSDETMEEVETFLKRKVRGEKDKTYGQLTSNYCLTVDPDGSVFKDYFRAAGQTGIPCAFIVGKTGLVEWIGHPASMEKPLRQIVDDEWDLEAFQIKFEKQNAANRLQSEMMDLGNKISSKIDADDAKGAVKLIDEKIKDPKYEAITDQLKSMRQQIVIMHVGGDEAAKALAELVEANSNDPIMLNQVAWTIYEQYEADNESVSKEVLAGATKAAEVGAKAAPKDGAILDTLAHLLYVSGDLDRALEVQEKALENAGGQEAEIAPFLKKLKAEKAKQEK